MHNEQPFGDLDTPTPRAGDRSEWDDYQQHRQAFLDRDLIQDLYHQWHLTAPERPAG